MIYFNMKSSYGVETVDSLDRKDFPNTKEYNKEVRSMVENYRMAGMNVYLSKRCTKEWRNK